MVEVTYIGAHDAVEIETRPGVFTKVAKNETIEVLDAVANGVPGKFDKDGNVVESGQGGLLEQTDTWKAAPKPAKKPTT